MYKCKTKDTRRLLEAADGLDSQSRLPTFDRDGGVTRLAEVIPLFTISDSESRRCAHWVLSGCRSRDYEEEREGESPIVDRVGIDTNNLNATVIDCRENGK